MIEFRTFIQTNHLALDEPPVNPLVSGFFDPGVLRLDMPEGNSVLDMRYTDLINYMGIAREFKNGDKSQLNSE